VRNVIVLGGSAGGIQSLCAVLASLPSDLDAAVLAVIHTSGHTSGLRDVLGRCSRLEVVSPDRAQPVVPGRVYVPAPNRHLVVKSNCVLSWMGPRENRHRPAVDTLFRSAARAYRSHVIAVVLSGALDDGTSGALAIKARGGKIIVQDPRDALMKQMPDNVLKQVGTDFCLPVSQISGLLATLVGRHHPIKVRRPSARDCRALDENGARGEMEAFGFSCPECGGVLLEIKDGKSMNFRCHVGHTFSLESFSEAHADALERALWSALRRLNEQLRFQESLARTEARNAELKKRHLEIAAATERDMKLLHEILSRL
jgi:two-component system chemotaxis response regulator CheB